MSATAQPTAIVRDIHTGQKLGAHIRTELAHYVYQDRKGRFGLARLDRSELRSVPTRVAAEPAPIYATHKRAYDGSPTTFWFSDAGLTRREGWANGYVADGSIRPADLGHEARRVVLMEAPGVAAAALKMAAE